MTTMYLQNEFWIDTKKRGILTAIFLVLVPKKRRYVVEAVELKAPTKDALDERVAALAGGYVVLDENEFRAKQATLR